MNLSFDPDVGVIGGGPIGLWTAIQIAASTGKKVLVIEKYPSYKREILLRINAASMKGLPDIEALKPLKKLAESWGGKSVSIKTMEDELTKCANQLGVKIIKGEAADPKTILEKYPNAKVFIGADGARSQTRKEFFGDQFRFNTPHQYLIQAQYKIKRDGIEEDLDLDYSHKKIQDIKKAAKTYTKQKFAGHLITENIKHLNDGTSQVTLRIFVNESTYKNMTDATFSNPYYFEEKLTKVPNEIREVLIKWWGQANQKIITEENKTNKLTIIPLASYASKEAFKVKKGKVIALAGDALQAFPFFRAINNGFLNGTKLSETVNNAFKNLEKNKSKGEKKAQESFINTFNYYSRYTTKRAYIERIKAWAKNLFLNISILWIKISRLVPWQTVKISYTKKRDYYNKGREIWGQLTGEVPPPLPQSKIFRKFSTKKQPLRL